MRWEELSSPATRPDGWTLRTIPERLERDGDPWADIHSSAQTLGAARRRLHELLGETLPG